MTSIDKFLYVLSSLAGICLAGFAHYAIQDGFMNSVSVIGQCIFLSVGVLLLAIGVLILIKT